MHGSHKELGKGLVHRILKDLGLKIMVAYRVLLENDDNMTCLGYTRRGSS